MRRTCSPFERHKIRNFIASSKLDGVVFTEQEIVQMTDKQIVEADVVARTALVADLNVVRSEAITRDTVEGAVDAALQGAANAVEQHVLAGGIATVVDLRQALSDSWVESVNS